MADSRDFKLNFTLKEMSITSSPDEASVPGSSSTVECLDKKLVCVEYPASVSRVDKMLETIGGERGVSRVSRQHLCGGWWSGKCRNI